MICSKSHTGQQMMICALGHYFAGAKNSRRRALRAFRLKELPRIDTLRSFLLCFCAEKARATKPGQESELLCRQNERVGSPHPLFGFSAEPRRQKWKRICTCRLRMVCAPVAAPNPAVLGVDRAGSSEPSARVCELRTVRSVGLLYCTWP